MKLKATKISRSDFKAACITLGENSEKYKRQTAEYENVRTNKLKIVGEYFEQNKLDKGITFEMPSELSDIQAKTVTITKAQRVSVNFIVDKLKKSLGNKMASNVITKRYEIIDMFGLVKYLKQCNVNPDIFKSFLNVTETVDVKELERLEEIGKISNDELDGCYTVTKGEPYFSIKVGK